MADWTQKRNDRLPEIAAALKDPNGAAQNLAGCTVRFVMRQPSAGAAKVNAAATVVDAAGGSVKYAWAASDTDTAGRYRAEWEVLFADGRRETFPNAGYLEIEIVEDLA